MDISRNLDGLAPGSRFVALLIEAVEHARIDGMPPERIAEYLRDLAQDVVETKTI